MVAREPETPAPGQSADLRERNGRAAVAEQIENKARAQTDVLLRGSDGLARTADELAELAGTLVQVSAARSRFLSKVAHELRTPLTIAKGWMSMLRYGTLLPEQERVVNVVDQQIDELTRLVNDLLDLSRRDADTLDLRRELVDLIALVEQVVEHQRELPANQAIHLVVSIQADDAFSHVDRGRIAQVLNNLIGNAGRYVAQDGGGRIELCIAAHDGTVQLTVRDNGIGIPPEHLPHICEPFYQIEGRQRGKSGLGLTVAYELVHAHGGSLTIESDLGKGTAFHIWLQRAARPAAGSTRARRP